MLPSLFPEGNGEEGQGLVEYALIIVLVSVALILALQYLATGISNVFSQSTSVLSGS